MRLIGMLDSPYVRRVAISLDVLGINFLHEPVSVFTTFEKFKSITPVVKVSGSEKLQALSERMELTDSSSKYPPLGPGVKI